jgi:hypothetical protein
MQKIKILTEYYKFHKDIPRMFMIPETNTLNTFYDKRRRFEYYRIAKVIEDENRKNPNRPPKGTFAELNLRNRWRQACLIVNFV